MKILITLVMMLAVTGVSYAGPAVSDLGVAVGVKDISDTAFQAPPAPADAKAETADKSFDEGLAKANCVTNPAAPGCPMFCKDHHAYPGCPMYCQSNPWHPACGHVPAYCHTNPNGYGCPKSLAAGNTSFDKGLAKAHCDAHPMAPGCPGYCKVSPAYPGCPMFCRKNHGHPACKKASKAISDDEDGDMKKVTPGYPKPPHPQWCSNHHGFPSCRKETPVTKSNCAYNPSAPGCSAYCASPGMQMQPGCPMYCASQPNSSSCQDK